MFRFCEAFIQRCKNVGIFVKLIVTVQHVPARGHVNNSNIGKFEALLNL